MIFRQGSKQAEVDFAYIELSAMHLDVSVNGYFFLLDKTNLYEVEEDCERM